jgi:hypothetical protein
MDKRVSMGKELDHVTLYGDAKKLGMIKDDIAGTMRIRSIDIKKGKGDFEVRDGFSFDANI